MLFHVLFQCQIAVTTGFMEETWSRNLLNIMTTPITEVEYAAGLVLYAFMKLVLAMSTISVVAFVTYQFNLGSVGWALVPIVGVLLLVGWALSLFVIGLILRYGQSAEILAWGTNFVMLALSGVFNPISALPAGGATDRTDPPDDVRVPAPCARCSTATPFRGATSGGASSARSCCARSASGSSSTCSTRSAAAAT